MKLLSTEIQDFRNYEGVSLKLHPRANLFLGPNGMGKTNILEAVYFLATATPLVGRKASDLIRSGQEEARVSGRVEQNDGEQADLGVKLHGKGRELLLRGKPAESAVDYFGNLEVVAFTPQDVQLFAAAPGDRRRFLDRVIFNHDPGYLELARRLKRLLSQRNRLLSEVAERRQPESILAPWDAQYAEAAAEVTIRRRQMAERLQSGLERVYDSIFGEKMPEHVRIRYASEVLLLESEPTGENMIPWMEEKRHGDVRRGHTSLGPHRDELHFEIEGHPVRSHGSQGQRRTLILALKLSEVLSLSEQNQQHPVILLDDLSSELDSVRARKVLDYLVSQGSQLLITSTAEGSWGEVFGDDCARFDVESGHITPNLV